MLEYNYRLYNGIILLSKVIMVTSCTHTFLRGKTLYALYAYA